jgi:putative exosortase-associated protein (TIGR04073 family)
MKRVVAVVALVSVLAAGAVRAEEEAGLMDTMMSGFTRGIVNSLTFWLEVPRKMSYEMTTSSPYFGWINGVGEGAVMGVWRATAGVLDIATLGTPGAELYTSVMPDYVWDAPWIGEAQ